MQQAKEETRKIGGNILHITKHIRLGTDGNSYHQLSANILRVSSPELFIVKKTTKTQKGTEISRSTVIEKMFPPTFDITINGGYGYAPKINPAISYEMKESNELMDRGGFWNIIFHNYPEGNLGWGINYSGFRMHTTFVRKWEFIPLYTYIAPQISYKHLFLKNGGCNLNCVSKDKE